MLIEPYLFFEGRCEEALAFYRQALGAEVTMLMRYKENPEPPPPDSRLPPGNEDKIMHANVRIGDSVIMVSDGMCSGEAGFHGFALSLSTDSEAEAKKWFTALSEKGEVRMPLAKTFFSPCFGMVTDRFGLSWMVNVMT